MYPVLAIIAVLPLYTAGHSQPDEEDDDDDEDEDDDDDDDEDDSDADNANEDDVDDKTDNEDDSNDEDDSDDDLDMTSDKAIVLPEISDSSSSRIELTELDEFTLEETNASSKNDQHESSVKNLNVVIDYKKASVNKLREIVEQKGLASDTSKLKKSDLLKLLEVYQPNNFLQCYIK